MMELPIRWYLLNLDTDPNTPPKGPLGERIFGWASGYLVGDRTSEQTHEHMLPGFRGGASTNTHSGATITATTTTTGDDHDAHSRMTSTTTPNLCGTTVNYTMSQSWYDDRGLNDAMIAMVLMTMIVT